MIKRLFTIIALLQKRIQRDDLSAWASQLTFYIILSLFPFLIFITEMIHRISFIDMTAADTALTFLPTEIRNFIDLLLTDLYNTPVSDTVLTVTLIAALWSSSKGIMSIIRALNIAYDETETRSFILLRLFAVLYTFIFALIIIIVLVLIVFGGRIIDMVLEQFPFLISLDKTFDLFRYLITLFSAYWFFIVIYNVTPNKKISIKDVTPGAILATVSWLLVSTGFSIYVNYSKNISYFYGSLTSIIILLLWLYATSMIIMIGGELNAIILNLQKKEKKQRRFLHFHKVQQQDKNDGDAETHVKNDD